MHGTKLHQAAKSPDDSVLPSHNAQANCLNIMEIFLKVKNIDNINNKIHICKNEMNCCFEQLHSHLSILR